MKFATTTIVDNKGGHTLVSPCDGNLGLERDLFLTFVSLIFVGLIKEHMTSYVSRTHLYIYIYIYIYFFFSIFLQAMLWTFFVQFGFAEQFEA